MEDELLSLLETFDVPVVRQGSLAPEDPYPAAFITFWNSDEDEQSFYDNKAALSSYSYDVNVYSSDPARAYSLLSEIRTFLKNHGWIIARKGFDVGSDKITHVGRGMQIVKLTH